MANYREVYDPAEDKITWQEWLLSPPDEDYSKPPKAISRTTAIRLLVEMEMDRREDDRKLRHSFS